MNDPYENLAHAIILQAVKDYRLAVPKLAKHISEEPPLPVTTGKSEEKAYDKWLDKKNSLLREIESIQQFFYSDWFEMLSGADGHALFERLRKEMD